MAQPITRTQVATLVGTAINETWTSSENLISPVFKQFLTKETSPHALHISYQAAYFTQVQKKNEGAPIEYDDIKFGTPFTVAPVPYALGVRLTKEAMLDMARDPYGESNNSKLASIARLGQAFRAAYAQTQDVLAAKFLTSATVTTASDTWQGVGYDNVALASAAHPILSNQSILGATTFSNLGASASLSQSTLQTILSTFETIPSLEGQVRQYGKKYKLVVGPGLRHQAYTAVETAKINKLAGSTDHDVPGLSAFDIEVVVNPFMGASSTVYGVFANDASGCNYWECDPPVLDDEEDFETKGHKYSIYGRQAFFHKSPYGVVISPGA